MEVAAACGTYCCLLSGRPRARRHLGRQHQLVVSPDQGAFIFEGIRPQMMHIEVQTISDGLD